MTTPPLAVPVDGWPGVNNLYRSERTLFAGQPDADSLARLAQEEGVRTVINLRFPEELLKVGLDEQAVVEELGITYVNVPLANAYTRDDVERFATAYETAEQPVVVHCGSSNRVGAIWALYLHMLKDIPLETALEHGAAAGLNMPPLVQAVHAAAARG